MKDKDELFEERRKWAEEIIDILNVCIPHPTVPLNHDDAYTLLIAVILSAQCTDERVNRITPLLFEKACSPSEMILLDEDEIIDIVRPCGLGPQKGRAIRELSRILLEKHEGKVPSEREKLEALPGVGRKSANVILSHIFDIPALPVDTHIARNAKRWKLCDSSNVAVVERELLKLFPEHALHRLHLQIVLFSRQFCPARGHDPSQCPICSKIPDTLKGEA